MAESNVMEKDRVRDYTERSYSNGVVGFPGAPVSDRHA